MTEPEIKALFESMVTGSATTEVEVFRTLRISGRRDAVLRTLGQSHVLHGVREVDRTLRLEGRMTPIRPVDGMPEPGPPHWETDPEVTARAILAVVVPHPRLLAALRRELDTVPHPGAASEPANPFDPFTTGRW